MTRRTPRSPRPASAAQPEGQAGATPGDVSRLSFEEALTQLEGIVDELEGGSLPLEEALAGFERGIHLSKHLERQLRTAEARVQKLVGGEADAPALVPLEAEDQEPAGLAEDGFRETGEDESAPPPDDDDTGEEDAGDRLF